jgi:hypothetical protein
MEDIIISTTTEVALVEAMPAVVAGMGIAAGAAVGTLVGAVLGGPAGSAAGSVAGAIVVSAVAHGVAKLLKHLCSWAMNGSGVTKAHITQQIDILEDRLYDIPKEGAEVTPAQRYELRTHWVKLLKSFRFSSAQASRMLGLKRALERRIPGLRLTGIPQVRGWFELRSK